MKKKCEGKAPKVVYAAVFILILIVSFVIINTLILSRTIKDLEKEAIETSLNTEDFERLYGKFLRARTYLSITVDHNDIATVEAEFAEIRGALSVGDFDSAAIGKSRLCSALGHLGRLSGFNIDSII